MQWKTCIQLTFESLLILLVIATPTTNADVPRPRGVSLAQASLYSPRNDKTWVCLDGTKTLRYEHINDDYCDCPDGSDEPGTSACTQGYFNCANIGHRSQDIPSSRVNDGICDCCDGSDEYNGSAGKCQNVCKELGRVEQEQRRTEAELHKRGSAKRAEMVAKGKQLRAEREARRAELERRRIEQEALKEEKEQLKRTAEAAESEALELYKEQQREQDAATAEATPDGPQATRVEAEAHFLRYDTNKDGFVEVTELQVDMSLDRDRNGVVTVEEAKYFIDERDRVDFDNFLALSWPRIKPMQMLAQGIFKAPELGGENEEKQHAPELQGSSVEGDESADMAGEAHHENNDDGEPEEDEEAYEEEDDVETGVGTATDETAPTPTPEYDPETQRLVEMANEARNAFSEVEREVREIDNEMKEIDDQNAKDYGSHEEYAALEGECYAFEDREYVYTLCPFDRASQKQRSGGAETTLGRWDQWIAEGGNKYAKQKYAHGSSCWNGPQRSAIVQLKCALEHRLTAVSEPNRCEYFFEFETPAACDGVNGQGDPGHDEL